MKFDSRRVVWRRVVDMNDRALRQITASLGGVTNGFPRESGFDITVASEVMAIFCLAENLEDLHNRLGAIIVGYTRERAPICAQDLSADGSMAVLLKDALRPNLVQTLENKPALIHGGPFANIAHGCNSVIATKTGLGLADYVVTEAGFGADLGAEKFFNIKCRKSELQPDAVVIVATIRALKYHGGIARDKLSQPNVQAVERGLENLAKHVLNVGQFGVPVVVGINGFESDVEEELNCVRSFCSTLGIEAISCTHWADGGVGAEELAHKVAEIADSGQAQFRTLYEDNLTLWEKARTISRSLYGAEDIIADKRVRQQFSQLEEDGFGQLPVCMAKTQYSFSTDPGLLGAPQGHMVPIREVRLAAGAGFIVAICGDIMTMPGLPRVPAANSIRIGDDGQVEGLF